MVLIAIFTVIGAYLVGSINFAVIFANVFLKKDVRDYGSGNAGTTNVMRVAGFLPGILTFICDVLKGIAACYGGKIIFNYIFITSDCAWANPVYGAYICGFACIIGHVFPLFFQFKGGKGVAASLGIFSVCCPLAAVIGLSIFIIIVLITQIVSLGSIIAIFVAVLVSISFYNHGALLWPQAVISIVIMAVIVLMHTENIKRLISGTESKLNIRRHKNG